MKKIIKSLLEYLKFVKPQDELLELDWESKLQPFFKTTGYSFKNVSLLKAAVTHNSYLRKYEEENSLNFSPFERMEFLGDSILGLIVSEELFLKYPENQEGNLSKMKSKLVSEKFLAKKALEMGLGEILILSEEEEKSGGRERKSILADAMESVLCAIYLDSGLRTARKYVKDNILTDIEKSIKASELRNYKSILQEHTQRLYQKPPTYKKIAEQGPDHDKTFTMEVIMNGNVLGSGKGGNKKEAQQAAAADACKKLGI